jgi:hypothetical protein
MPDYINEPQSEEEYEAVTKGIVLPEWMDYPEEEKTIYTLVQDGDTFLITETGERFDDVESAYDYISKDLDGDPDLSAIKPRLLFTEKRRLLLSFTSEDHRRLDRYNYWSFLQRNEEYLANQDDWFNAYHWLVNHPAFYHRIKGDLNRWISDDGLAGLSQSIYKRDDGEIVVLLEHGAWGDADKTGQAYHDYRIEVSASTIEDAYVALAKRVHENFAEDGIDYGKEGVKPKWYAEVEARLAEYKDGKENLTE